MVIGLTKYIISLNRSYIGCVIQLVDNAPVIATMDIKIVVTSRFWLILLGTDTIKTTIEVTNDNSIDKEDKDNISRTKHIL